MLGVYWRYWVVPVQSRKKLPPALIEVSVESISNLTDSPVVPLATRAQRSQESGVLGERVRRKQIGTG